MRYLIFTLAFLCCAHFSALADDATVPPRATLDETPRAIIVSPNLSEQMYRECKVDDDCAVVTPPCSAPMTFNKKSQLFLQGYFNRAGGSFTCADWIKIARLKKLSCVKERCAIELTEPQTPPPQTAFDKEPQYCEKNSDCEMVIGDCCEASYLNKPHADRMRADMVFGKDARKICLLYDRRKVVNLRCENKKCTADLEVPPQLDYTAQEMQDCKRWK